MLEIKQKKHVRIKVMNAFGEFTSKLGRVKNIEHKERKA